MIVTKKVEGEVDYNDGQFAEGTAIGIEGIEKDLLLSTFQIHRENAEDTPDEFRQRLAVGTRLKIVTTTEITTYSDPSLIADAMGHGFDDTKRRK